MSPPSPRSRIALAACVLAVACGKGGEPPAAPKPTVYVVPVVAKDVDLYTEWVGTTTGLVDATIRPKVQGYLLKQEYEDGSVVEPDQLLFQIDPRQFKASLDAAKGRLDVQRAILGKAEIDVTRFTPLAARGAVSQQELDDAIQARAAARASVAEAQADVEEAQLNLAWTKIKSPIPGIAGIAKAQVGDLVSPVTVLTTVSQVDPIKVSFPISELQYLEFARRRDDPKDESERTGNAPLELLLADGTVYSHPGRFTVADRAVSQTTGTITLQGVFPNPERLLRPGQYAKIRALTEKRKGALVIPQRAVKQGQDISQVVVVGDDGKAKLVAVTLGPRTGEDWIVDEGVTAGQRVVVEGIQKIRDGMEVAASAPPDTGSGASQPGPPEEKPNVAAKPAGS